MWHDLFLLLHKKLEKAMSRSYLHKKLKKKLQLLNSENNGKIYLFKSVITLFPVSVSLDGRDEHGLKLEKVGQTFSMVLILLVKIGKNVMVSALSDKRCFISSS